MTNMQLKKQLALLVGAVGLALTTGCASQTGIGLQNSGARDRVADYQQCLGAVSDRERSLHAVSEPTQYLGLAREMRSCTTLLSAAETPPDRLADMRLYAAATLYFLQGGDLDAAAAMYEGFNRRYPGRDLIFPDGSSWQDSLALLLGESGTEDWSVNARPELKQEWRRLAQRHGE